MSSEKKDSLTLSVEQIRISDREEEERAINHYPQNGAHGSSDSDDSDINNGNSSLGDTNHIRTHYLPESFSNLEFKSPLDFLQVFLVTSRWTNLLNSISVREYLLFKKSQEFHTQSTAPIRTPSPPELILVSTDTTISDCLNIFRNNSILSAPVIERISPPISPKSTSPRSQYEFINGEDANMCEEEDDNIININQEKFKLRGVVDLLDILALVLSITRRHKQIYNYPQTSIVSHSIPHTYQQSIKQALNLLQTTILDHIPEDYSLLRATELLLKPSTPFKSHRLPVLNSKNEIVGIFSLTDILYIAQRNIHLFNGVSTKKAKELKILHPVISLTLDSKSSEVFSILVANRISGVAIVDVNGKLLTTVSPRDIRDVQLDQVNFMSKTISEFLMEKYNGEFKKPLIISENDILVDILNLMCDNNSHTVYMVDGAHKPLTVTSIADVISALLNC